MAAALPWIALAFTVGSTAYQYQQQKKARKKAKAEADARKGFELVIEGEPTALPVVYGKAKIGGVRSFHNTSSTFNYVASTADKTFDINLNSSQSGSKNEYLIFQQALCQGGISSVKDIIINGTQFLNDPVLSDNAGIRVDVHFNGSTVDPLLKANAPERADALFTGVAYANIYVKLNRDDPQFGGVPDIQFLVEGRKVRKVLNGVLQSTYAYSNNPAWVLLDYLLEFRKVPVEDIILTSFESAAALCDTIKLSNATVGGNFYRPALGGIQTSARNVPLYETNITLDSAKPFRENVEAVLETMGDGRLVWSQGKYKLNVQYPGVNNEGVIVSDYINDDDLVLGKAISIKWPSAEERLNNVTVRFNNESENFKEDTVSWPNKPNSSYTRGIGGFVYPAVSGWDTSAGGRFLNAYGVWEGNSNTTDLTYKIKAKITGDHILKFTADDLISGSVSEYTFYPNAWTLYLNNQPTGTSALKLTISGSDWRSVKTQTLFLEEGKVYEIRLNATNNKDIKGVAATLTDPSNVVIWTTREPSYAGFEEISFDNTVYLQMLAEDNNVELESDIFVQGITDYYHAKAKAEELVRTSRSAFSIKFTYIVKDKYLEPGDVIQFSSESIQLGLQGPLYIRVDSISLKPDLQCEIQGSRFDGTQLAWNVADNEYLKPISSYNEELPAPYYLEYVPDVNDIYNGPGSLNWPPVDDSRIVSYNLYMHKEGQLDISGNNLFKKIGSTSNPPFGLPDLIEKDLIFGIKSVANTGRMSKMTVTNLINLVRAAPPVPSNVTAVAYGDRNQSVKITWEIPLNRPDGSVYNNHSATFIYRSKVNDITLAQKVGESLQSTEYIDTPSEFGTLYYWVKFISYAGVSGVASDPVSLVVDFWQVFVDDLFKPPAPTNLQVSGVVNSIILTWEQTAYSGGGGHDYAIIYGQKWLDGQLEPTFSYDTVISTVKDAKIYRHTVEPGERWIYWVKEKSRNSGLSDGYAGPAVAVTEYNPVKLIEAIEGHVTKSTLSTELQAEIDSVDPLAIQVMSNKIDDVYGSYTVKIDHNNHVSGYGLASEANNGTPISSFIVAADRFAIGAPTVANSDFNLNNQYPFIHLSAPTVVDGITMQPGTYLKRAFLADATITNAKIVTLDAEKITTGYLNADRIAAGSIKAGKIDSRGLSIYDEFGNVILAAGSGLEGLEWDYVKGAAKPQDGATRNVYVGIWTLGSGYLIGDIVQYEGSGWTCVQNHTATALNKPPESGISNTYWTLHALKGDPGQAGLPGVNGTRTAILDMYKWAEEQPISGFPSGTSTYTWSTAQFTAPATPNGWELVPPSPVVGQTLWMVRQLYSDQQTSSQTVIGWTANVATPAGASGPQGPSGVPGTRTGILELYKWAQTTPTTFPQGTSTYTWDTGSFTLPATLNGWTLLPGAPVAGYLLWACSERIIDNTTAPTSNKNWSTVTAYAIGGSGLNAISAIIDNESHSCPSSADGVTVNYVNSGCKITVFEGTTALIFNTGTLTAGQFSIGTPVVNPTGKLVVGARSGSGTTTATVAQHSAFLSDTDVVTITYPLTVKRLDGTNTSISKVQTITKSKAGVVGVSAKIAILTASAQIIHISKTAVVSPATITLSAFGQNLTGSPTFTVVTGTLSASMTGTGTTRTLNTSAVTTDSIVIKITWDGQEDYVTIAKVREGLDGSAGSSGADGDSIDIIFQRAATQPATPTASASIPSGWYSDVVSVPASSNPIWSSVGSKPSGASNYTWNTPLKIEGSDGYSGVSVVELTIFRRSASALTTPTGGAYNFATKVLTPPSGWSISVPVGTDPVYTSRATVTSTNLTATAVSPGTWTSPVISFQNGNTGVDGITIVLSNESHSLPASSDGVVSSYLNSGTTIVVYEGTTALSAVSPITGNSQFSIGTPTQSPLSTLTVGARTYAGTTGTVAAHSGMVNGTDSVTITYPISIRRANGTNIIINKTQTLTKSKTGSIGAQGPAVVVTSSRATTFTATDGTLDGSQADIVLTASVSGVTSPTYAWTFSGLQTNPTASTTNTQTITAAQFGTAKSATVTCTVNGTYKDQVTLVRLEKSTAAAGATVGSNLSDPFSTATWYPGHHTFETVPDGKVGSLVLRLNTGSSNPEQIRYIPLDRTKKYRVRFWARPQAGANGTLYFTLRQYISPGVFGPNNTGLTPYKPASVTPGVHNTNFGTDAWGEYSYIWTTADWQTDVTLVRPLFLRNYGGTVGYWEVQDLRFEEVTEVEAAKDSAAAANSLLADIAADSKLTPVEKQSVRAEWDTVYAERAGIRTQADGFSITAEKTAYDTAFQALGTYLNAGTAYTIGATPPSWIADAGLSSTTDIVGATFRSNWAALYTARQALLNKIAAEAAKRADWANVSGANKPEDGATKNRIFTQATAPTGAANGDIWIDTSVTPSVQKMMVGGAWQLAATVGATLAEFVVNSTLLNEQFTTGFGSNWTNRNGGGNASQGTGQGSTDGNYVYFGDNSGDDQVWYVRTGALIAYDSAKLYRMRVRARKTAGDGVCYIGLEGVAANRTTIVDPDGGSTGIGHYFVLSVSSIGPDWTEYAGFVQGKAATGDASARPSFSDPGKMHNNVAFVRPVIISNYPSRPGYTDVDYCILEEGYVRSGNIGGKIDAANVTTFIDNAAIGAAQIGSVELVGESAFKVRTNNSAGARMDMDSRRIKIFDANGTLRVQLGDLTV